MDIEAYSETHDNVWRITREQGFFLNALVKNVKAKRILELGTSVGYSGIFLAEATKQNDGKLITIDKDPEKIRISKENFKKSGLKAEVIEGDCLETAKSLVKNGKTFDFVFIDANKKGYLPQFKEIFNNLEKNAVVVADNVIDLQHLVKDYLGYVRKFNKVESILIDIGHGMELTRKK